MMSMWAETFESVLNLKESFLLSVTRKSETKLRKTKKKEKKKWKKKIAPMKVISVKIR